MRFQRRYRHFIRPCKQSVYPTCIVAVEASSGSEGEETPDVSRQHCLNGWTASTATFNQGIHRRTWHATGDNAADWWRYLDSVLRYNTNLWVASWNTPRTVNNLGLWDEMEARRCYLTGTDQRSTQLNRCNGRQAWQGYAVLQNPPTILCFKRSSLPGTVTWL